MQWNSIELGAFHDQHPRRQFIFEDAVAAYCACRFRHSAGHFAERISHPGNLASLCECGPADDPQSNPSSWWTSLFRSFVDSVSSGVVVAPQGGGPKSTS